MYYTYIIRCRDNSLYTGYTIDIKRRLREHTKGINSKYTRSRGFSKLEIYFVCAMVLLPWVIFRNNIIFDSTKSIILILILGIAHTGIAYCLYFSAMKDLKAQSIAILGYLDPVSSVVFSIFLLKEPFSIYQLIGGVIILLSAVIAERNPKPKTIENGEINL